MSYVVVDRPSGRTIFQQAEADVFQRDTLTISHEHSGEEWETLKPGTWLSATVFDSVNDLPRYGFESVKRQAQIDAVAAKYQPERTVA